MSSLKRLSGLFYLAGLGITALAGWLQHAPGYMDADYYFSSGLLLIKGSALSQPFAWNYLAAPATLPVAAYTYWMPLGGLLAGLGAWLGGGFASARLPFWLLAAGVAPLTLWLGMALHGDKRKAILGAAFALFPVYYLAYFPTTDIFAVYMLLGGGIGLLIQHGLERPWRWGLAGLLAGGMHLARADGLFWLAGLLLLAGRPLIAALPAWRKPPAAAWRMAAGAGLWVLGGYFLPMGWWYARNLAAWGTLFAPGNGYTLWLTRYEDTFLFPAAQITPGRWLASGWEAILAARWEALLTNLQTWVGVQGSIALFPFALGGLALLRKREMVRFLAAMWLITFLAMTFLFPYAGINGSFFHSGAAFQPLMWAAAPLGIEAAMGWLARKRAWQRGAQARRFVEAILVISCVLLSGFIYLQKLAGTERGEGLAWNRGAAHYRAVEQQLVDWGAEPEAVVMVNNPPGYYAVNGRAGLVVPFGDEEMVAAAARKYGADYLVLEENDAGHLARLFETPQDYPGLVYLGKVDNSRIYAFSQNP